MVRERCLMCDSLHKPDKHQAAKDIGIALGILTSEFINIRRRLEKLEHRIHSHAPAEHEKVST